MKSEIVLTDSGGIQEETSALGVPCVTLRTTTERPITIEKGSNVLCTNLNDLTRCFDTAMMKKGRGKEIWDGKAAKRIVNELLKN